MGSKGGTPPPAPNPYAVASAQTQGNLGTAVAQSYLNNVNQYGPNGSLTYQKTGSYQVQVPDGQGGYTSVDLPTWAQTTTLSPQQQQMQDQQNQLGIAGNQLALSQIDRLSGVLSQPMDTSSIPGVQSSFDRGGNIQTDVPFSYAPTTFGNTAGNIQYDVKGSDDFAKMGEEAQDAIMARLRPQLDQSRSALDSRLANQGIELGSEAYRTAQNIEGQHANDAQTQAVLAGFQRQNDLFGQNLQAGQFHNSAQGQDYSQLLGRGQFAQAGIGQNNAAALNAGQFHNAAQNQGFNQNQSAAQFNNQASAQTLQQMLALRNQPLNEISALRSGGQVSLPQFQGYQSAQVQGTPIGQYMYQSAGMDNNNYWQQQQMQQSQQNALMGGLFGLGSAGLFGLSSGKLSDRRLKKEIKRIGELASGLAIYSFRYLWGDLCFGYMADEVETLCPQAVTTNASGFKSVDYALAA